MKLKQKNREFSKINREIINREFSKGETMTKEKIESFTYRLINECFKGDIEMAKEYVNEQIDTFQFIKLDKKMASFWTMVLAEIIQFNY